MRTIVTLRLKQTPDLPIEAESLIPSNVGDKSLDAIYALPLLHGNRDRCVGDFFSGEIATVAGEGVLLLLQGDLARFKRIGQEMNGGDLIVDGNVGFHTGAAMRDGKLTVKGNAGDWLGAHMRGGLIVVDGNAGHSIGAAYRGKTKGMNGGTILIHGNAGQMVGANMRRGIIAVAGSCLDALGYQMKAGTILVKETAGRRIGAGMRRGTIIFFYPADLMPTFYRNCDYLPAFWALLYRELQTCGFPMDESHQNAVFTRYSGDALTGGKGEVLIGRRT
jgi:formylmethanofuran dehydrogenase subunit C